MRHDGDMTEVAGATPRSLYDKHAATLDKALAAIAERGYWSAYPESPSPRVYGETAAADGQAAFQAYLGADFPLDQPGTTERVATERSPFGVPLDVRYPHPDVDVLLGAAAAASSDGKLGVADLPRRGRLRARGVEAAVALLIVGIQGTFFHPPQWNQSARLAATNEIRIARMSSLLVIR